MLCKHALSCVAAFGLVLFFTFNTCLSQDKGDEPCAPLELAHFPSAEDSLAWAQMSQEVEQRSVQTNPQQRSDDLIALFAATDSLLNLARKSFGDTPHHALIMSWIRYGNCRFYLDPERSMQAYTTAMQLIGELFPCETFTAVYLRNNLGTAYFAGERYADAITVYRDNCEAVSILDSTRHDLLANNFFMLAYSQIRQQQYSDALESIERTFYEYRRSDDTSGVLECYYLQSLALFSTHDFDATERCHRDWATLARSFSSGTGDEVLNSLEALATFYESVARYDEAKQVISEALKSLQRPGASVDPMTQWNLYVTLARLHQRLGEYVQEEQMHSEALRISSEVPEEFRAQVMAGTLNNWGIQCEGLGRHEQAMSLLQRSLQLLDSIPANSHVRLQRAKLLGTIGAVHHALGDHDVAEDHLRRSIDGISQEVGSDAYELSIPLINLALLHRDMGFAERGLPHAQKALALVLDRWEDNHPLSALMYKNLSSLELRLGQDDKAITHIRQAIDILDQWYDEENPEYLHCLYLHAQWLERNPDADEAARIMRQLAKGTIARLRYAFAFDSERQQLRIQNEIVIPYLSAIARWAVQPDAGREAPAILFDAVMVLKGAVLSENERLQSSLHLRTRENALYEELSSERQRFASLVSRKPGSQDESVSLLRATLLARIDSLDGALRRMNRGYESYRRVEDADWRDIRKMIRSDEVLIDYLAYSDTAGSASRSYLALVLRARKQPVIVPLCREADLEKVIVADLTRSASSLKPDPERMQNLYHLLWEPLLKDIGAKSSVSIVPDAILHRLAFAALNGPDMRGAEETLDEQITLRQYVSSRELLRRDPGYSMQQRSPNTSFFLIGNPAFTRTTDVTLTGRKVSWKPLPGTKHELNRIEKLCEEFGIEFNRAEMDDASEEHVKELSGNSPRVLHLATHGFFYPEKRHSARQGTQSTTVQRGRSYIVQEVHPLLRSGLILAGANAAWRGNVVAAEKEDGILTALEVSRLNLEQTELAVLSACETALGDLQTGEGVFGLQRAFRSAGVSALIMSLWKVQDQATVDFMEQFYRNWLGGMNKVDAIRTARRTLRETYDNPSIWAAFVLIGD